MAGVSSLEELWASTPPAARTFEPDRLAGLPNTARRYLEHAIAPGTPLASAVRVRMHGEIKLQGWLPFSAEQVIRRERGMIWRATVRIKGLSIRGFDRLVDGEGEMRWKLLDLIPVMTASGPDITRSAAGRVGAEFVWLPSALCGDDVSWTETDSSHARASFSVQGEKVEPTLAVDAGGRLQSLELKRWGNPENADFHYADFGGLVEDEATFSGYTIPTRMRAGWYFGDERFEAEGEFFRVTIDDAQYEGGK